MMEGDIKLEQVTAMVVTAASPTPPESQESPPRPNQPPSTEDFKGEEQEEADQVDGAPGEHGEKQSERVNKTEVEAEVKIEMVSTEDKITKRQEPEKDAAHTKEDSKAESSLDNAAAATPTSNNNNNTITDTTIKTPQSDRAHSASIDKVLKTTPKVFNEFEAEERLKRIKRLKAKLINEEHRLVLMKRIRQSQTRPVNSQQQQQQQQNQQHRQQQQQQIQNHHHQQQQATAAASQQQHQHQLNQMNSSTSSMNNLLNNFNSNQNPNPTKKLRPNNSLSGLTANSLASGLSAANLAQLGQLGQQANNLLLSNPSSLAQQVNNAAVAALNQAPAHAHQRPKNNNLWTTPVQQLSRQPTPAGIAPPHVGNVHRPPITTPPNVVQDVRSLISNQQQQLANAQLSNRRAHINMSKPSMTSLPNMIHDNRANMSGQQSLLMNASSLATPSPSSGSGVRARGGSRQQSITPQHHHQQQSPFNKSQAAQMLLQKRQAAKSAIQKQVEQTLMQLPDKRIQLGVDFIPNANNIEFVYYIGLEACVDYLTNSKNPLDTQPLEKPFECSTCGTDFTPSWSWKRSNPVCENCVSNHVKRSIKNSQTNRIKSVLSKAAKQEQDMDQRIMAEAASVVTPSSSSPLPSIPTTSTNHHRHSSLLQPTNTQSPRSTPQSTSAAAAPWPRVNPSPLASVNRSSNMNASNAISQAANLLPNLNLNNPLAALGNLPPATLASLLQLNPQLGSLASLMTANAAPAAAPNNNNNQIAQVAALLMNQLTMNLWNKR